MREFITKVVDCSEEVQALLELDFERIRYKDDFMLSLEAEMDVVNRKVPS